MVSGIAREVRHSRKAPADSNSNINININSNSNSNSNRNRAGRAAAPPRPGRPGIAAVGRERAPGEVSGGEENKYLFENKNNVEGQLFGTEVSGGVGD